MAQGEGGEAVPPDDAASGVEVAMAGVEHVTFKAILLGGGPRFARDAFGPVLAFYIGWSLAGLVVGIAAATAVSLVAWQYERRRDRAGLVARLSLGFVIVQAVIGLVSQSATVYLAQPVLLAAAFGFAFLFSAAIGRPLAGVFASEIYPFPPEVRESKTFVHVFGRISILWGVYQLLRSGIRLVALVGGGVEIFLVVNLVTGVPLTAGLMSWSIWYGLRAFRRSDEWGWALTDPPPEPS